MYLLLPALLLVITSCNDKLELEDDNSEFKFQKELTIQDGNGNSADLVIYANDEEILADQTRDVLYLNTSTEERPKSINTNSGDVETEDNDDMGEMDVFVFVAKHNLNSDVTGFSVRSKLESNTIGEIETRATKYEYGWGSNGVQGVWVEYYAQTCNIEYLKVRLRSKNSASGSYSKLGSKKLSSEGDDWQWVSGTIFYKYQLRIRSFFSCSDGATYAYEWLP